MLNGVIMKKVTLLLGFALAAFSCMPSFAAQNLESEQKEHKQKVQAAQEAPQCVICLSDLGNNIPREALECGHVFHTVCLDGWRDHNTCPTCRTLINQNAPQQPAPAQLFGNAVIAQGQPAQQLILQNLANLIEILVPVHLEQPITLQQQLTIARQQNQRLQNQLNVRTRALHRAQSKAREKLDRSRNLGFGLAASAGFTAGVTNYLPTTIAKIGTGLAFSTSLGLMTAQHRPASQRKTELLQSSLVHIAVYAGTYALGSLLRYASPYAVNFLKKANPINSFRSLFASQQTSESSQNS